MGLFHHFGSHQELLDTYICISTSLKIFRPRHPPPWWDVWLLYVYFRIAFHFTFPLGETPPWKVSTTYVENVCPPPFSRMDIQTCCVDTKARRLINTLLLSTGGGIGTHIYQLARARWFGLVFNIAFKNTFNVAIVINGLLLHGMTMGRINIQVQVHNNRCTSALVFLG